MKQLSNMRLPKFNKHFGETIGTVVIGGCAFGYLAYFTYTHHKYNIKELEMRERIEMNKIKMCKDVDISKK